MEGCSTLKVGTHEGTSPCDYSPRKSLHEGTGRSDLSHEQFTRSFLKNKSQGLLAKIQTGLNSWDQSQEPKLVPATIFLSRKGQFTRLGLSPRIEEGLVAGTGPLVCADRKTFMNRL